MLNETLESETSTKKEQAIYSQVSHTGLSQGLIDLTCDMLWDYSDIKHNVFYDYLESITNQICYHQKHLLFYEELKQMFEQEGLMLFNALRKKSWKHYLKGHHKSL